MKLANLILVILCAVIIFGGAYYFAFKEPTSDTAQQEQQATTTPQGKPKFSWSYFPTSREDIPETRISLTATYPDGSVTTKAIQIVEGDCNDYQNPDADVYASSTMIICYYAGFGRYYKVVEEGNMYAVKRKEFEEASPDYHPPILPFETVATF